MSTPISERAIRTHTGPQSFQRGLRYHREHRVARRELAEGVVRATVRGTRPEPYEVEIALDDRGLHSMCTCPMYSACKHVAAVLLAYAQEPGSFARVAAEPALPTALPELEAWAAGLGVADMAERPVQSFFPHWELYNLPFSPRESALEALAAPAPASPFQAQRLRDIQARLRRRLTERAAQREAAAAYNERARDWRRVPPDEPWLRSLYEWSLAAQGEAALHDGPADLFDPLATSRSDDPPRLTFSREEDLFVPLQPGAGDPPPTPTAARCLLDLLTHPRLAGSELREWVSVQVRIPAWQRTLAALDAVAEEHRAAGDPEGRAPGWRVDLDPRVAIEPVWTRPYKRKPGLRCWKMSLHDMGRVGGEADRAACDAALAGHTRDGPVRALAQLVGHPNVVAGDGTSLAVREGELGVDWVPVPDGLVLRPTLGGDRLDEARLVEALRRAAADRLVFREGPRLVLARCPPLLRLLLRELVSRDPVFPEAAVGPLLERFETLSAVAPMNLRGALRGERVHADSRPLIRLDPAPDGALEVELLARPLLGARPHPPGQGPAEVAAVSGGRRVYAERDRASEARRFRELATALGLPEQSGFSWKLDAPEDALPVVLALREAAAAFQVEWVRPEPKISRPATAGQLKLKGGVKRDWLGIEGELEVEGERLGLAELLAAIRAKRRFVKLADGGFVHLSRRLAAQLEDTAARSWETAHGVAIAPLAAETLREVEADGAELDLPEAFALRSERLREADALPLDVPEGLCATLRPYQVEGFAFLARLAHWSPGAVLADDMGLGKTVQTLALLLRRAPRGPALVVAPASVQTNWMREAARFAPSLDVRPYRGTRRLDLLDELGPNTVLVTSWDLMARDVDALAAHPLATLVLDEAQAIKNPGTRRARASARLDAGFVVALTGTPVENRVGEVWSLFRTVVPGLLGPARVFREQFVGPIERDGSPRAREALSRLIQPFVLRRLKSEVARDLPPREEVEVRIALSGPERRLYDRFRRAAIDGLAEAEGGEDQIALLAALTRLRQYACDPRLVDPECRLRTSSKLQRLVELATDLRDEGHQALVFSQFTGLLGLAREALEAAGLSVRYLDGSTSLGKRQDEVDAFQRGEGDVFLISLKAGGVGLNLTAASYVVHLDPWWNPAAEDQATDRAHRIGQTQPVTVYRFVAVDTVEEEVLAMHAEKRALVEGLLAGTGSAASLTAAELMRLLAGQPAAAEPDEDWASATLARFAAHLEAAVRAGELPRPAVVEAYADAGERLVAWVEAEGGALSTAEDVLAWGERYLEAVDAGELPEGFADLRHGKAAYRRLATALSAG